MPIIKKLIAFAMFLLMTFPINAQTVREYCLIGHRGAASDAPENTLASIDRALEWGVDAIEIDVHLTSDGAVVLMHDRTLNRTTNGKGKVKRHTLQEILNLDAGSWFSEKFNGEKVPTLDAVIERIAGRCTLLIEVKEHSGYSPGVEKAVAESIRKHNASAWCKVISLKHKVIRNFHSDHPDILLQRSYVGKVPLLPIYISNFLTFRGMKNYPYVEAFNMNKSFIFKRVLRKAERLGKKIHAWTDDDPNHAQKLIKKGVHGIITNDPGGHIKAAH